MLSTYMKNRITTVVLQLIISFLLSSLIALISQTGIGFGTFAFLTCFFIFFFITTEASLIINTYMRNIKQFLISSFIVVSATYFIFIPLSFMIINQEFPPLTPIGLITYAESIYTYVPVEEDYLVWLHSYMLTSFYSLLVILVFFLLLTEMKKKNSFQKADWKTELIYVFYSRSFDPSKILNYISIYINNSTLKKISDSKYYYILNGITIVVPYRIYFDDVSEMVLDDLTPTEQQVLHCIYSRHSDGFVREYHLKKLLENDIEDFVVPFIIKLSGEYVLELLELIYSSLENKDTIKFKKFAKENKLFMKNEYDHMVSYWSSYYRNIDFDHYVGKKLFNDLFDYSATSDKKRVSFYQQIVSSLDKDENLPSDFILEEEFQYIEYYPDNTDINIYSAPIMNDLLSFNKDRIKNVAYQLAQLRYTNIFENVTEKYLELPMEDQDKIYETARNLIRTTSNVQILILAITLFKQRPSEKDKKVIITLSKYSPFSYFTLDIVKQYKTGNEIIFHLMKNANEYYKTNYLENLEVNTDVIKNWLLYEAWEYEKNDYFFAFLCLEKINATSILEQVSLDQNTFNCISKYIALIIDQYEDNEDFLLLLKELYLRYMNHSLKYCDNINILIIVTKMYHLFNDIVEAKLLYQEILQKKDWEREIRLNLKKANTVKTISMLIYLSNSLNIDISKEIYIIIKKNPVDFITFLYTIKDKKEFLENILFLYQDKLPLDKLASGMGNKELDYFNNEEKNNLILNVILQNLDRIPLIGMPFIYTGLQSPVIKNRESAISVLEKWIAIEKTNIVNDNPKLSLLINYVYQEEIDPLLKRRLYNLKRKK